MNTDSTDTAILTAEKADGKDEIVHHILCSVDNDATVSQRQLAKELNIALGSVNWYLKRCISKGLIKIQQVPLKRYMYYLTPEGFDQKSRLTAQYLKHSFHLFRQGRLESARMLDDCALKGFSQIFLVGDGDLAEIFVLSAVESSLDLAGVIDPKSKNAKRINVPIIKSFTDVTPSQDVAFIITNLIDPDEAYQFSCQGVESLGLRQDQIFVPELLNYRPATAEEKS